MTREFDVYDYLFLTLVLLVSLGIGLYQTVRRQLRRLRKRFVRTVDECAAGDEQLTAEVSQIKDYLIAGGTMGTAPIAFSLLATNISGNVLLGFPAEIYEYGAQFWIGMLGIALTPFLGALLTGPMFLRLKVMSVFEYFKIRYNSNVIRLIGVFCYFIRIVLSTSMYIFGPSTTVNALLGVDGTWAIVLIGGLATFYTCIGGIRAVIWTDFFQVCIMFTGMLIVIFVGTYHVGGFAILWKINELGGRINFFDFDLNPFIRQSFWSLIIGIAGQFCMQYGIDQQMVQRFLAAKSKRTAQTALLLNIPGVIFLLSICSFTGLVIFGNYAQCDPLSNKQIKHPNQILPFFVSNYLSNYVRGITGLFLAAILAAALSSVSSTLNSLASILWEDVLKRWTFFKSLNDTRSTLTTKLLVLFCGILCTFLALLFIKVSSNITQISGMINGAFTAPIVGLFLLSSLFPFSNVYGACTGTIVGLIASIWLSVGTYLTSPKYPKLGVSRECCNSTTTFSYCDGKYFTENSTALFSQNTKLKEASNVSGFSRIYSISYHWYSVIPIIITIVVGVLVSVLTKGCKQKVDRKMMLYNVKNNCTEARNEDDSDEEIEMNSKVFISI